jgi:hypothetical protein
MRSRVITSAERLGPDEFLFDDALDGRGGDHRCRVLQLGQLCSIGRRQEITAGREHLPELDERRPKLFERDAQVSRSRSVGLACAVLVRCHPAQAQRSQLRQPLPDQYLGDVPLTRA